ncbi:hypothetical protein DOTSEDRAFT_72343 [Dothistroma septosporum NZE10]|uniref:Uncharacterized protein n=1 Tax=Dothistroma septosporum (strain NZE10 / CBS 128990) TaxID=675120 RepID=M2XK60_DOTSN|nr:hypothetical protein DOTSEDRAFT_72343 [Dothistroma septosporum NZE10]
MLALQPRRILGPQVSQGSQATDLHAASWPRSSGLENGGWQISLECKASMSQRVRRCTALFEGMLSRVVDSLVMEREEKSDSNNTLRHFSAFGAASRASCSTLRESEG